MHQGLGIHEWALASITIHKINIIELVLFVARVGILLDFANFGNVNMFHRLT